MNALVSPEDWALHRREMLAEPPAIIASGGAGVLLPYQQDLVRAVRTSQLTVTDKSRRVGATWGIGAEAVLTSGAAKAAGGMDTLYLGYNLDMAREFIDTCSMWGRAFGQAASTVQEFLFTEEGERGADRSIQAFRISFASGFEIVALSSKPRSLRGRQGFVILDEFAFHDEAAELLKAAFALLIWGGKVLVISTHNGVDNPFNQLIQDIRAGRRPGTIVRVTFDDALRQGLYQRICLVKGREWTPEGEAAWRLEIRQMYGSGAAEELDCIPSMAAGAFLSRALIEARMSDAIPVIRWKSPAGMVDWPEFLRIAEVLDFCERELKPLLAKLDPTLRSCLGGDFGRSGDLSVFHPLQITRTLRRKTLFLLELRDVPFESQKQILFYIIDRLSRFSHAALDATGNGAFLAEVARQKYGVSVISEIKLSTDWYMMNMPKLKAAFEDDTFDLPKDDDVGTDYRAIQMVKGIAKVPDNARSKGADGFDRHGDAAIAGALAIFASGQDTGQVRADPLGLPRTTPALMEGYAFAAVDGGLSPADELADFRRM